jgi:two-component system, NtrC family, response regulator AtoC
VIERAIILSNGDELLAAHLPYEIVGMYGSGDEALQDPWEQWLKARPPGPMALEELSGRLERCAIRWALEMTQHNRVRAAELLGFAKVDQLRYLMRKHGVE